MKSFHSLYLSLIISSIVACTQTNQDQKVVKDTINIESDTIILDDSEYLASEWGADQYGMKQYVMAFLKAGPNRDQDSTTAAEIQKAHLENITRMAEEGSLVLAGPFLDDDDVRGIYVFNVQTIEEAEALTNTDPAVKAGRLIMELHPWYGSAALMAVTNLHEKIQSKSISD